jgi:hypothetical protein
MLEIALAASRGVYDMRQVPRRTLWCPIPQPLELSGVVSREIFRGVGLLTHPIAARPLS